jgi:hypothetical protein
MTQKDKEEVDRGILRIDGILKWPGVQLKSGRDCGELK